MSVINMTYRISFQTMIQRALKSYQLQLYTNGISLYNVKQIVKENKKEIRNYFNVVKSRGISNKIINADNKLRANDNINTFGIDVNVINDIVIGYDDIMKEKVNGSCVAKPKKNLRWKIDSKLANGICCFNRHYAEPSGFFNNIDEFLKDIYNANKNNKEFIFYDTITDKPLFIAPRGRTLDDFIKESSNHGWPSFRLNEVVWDNVRVLSDGETVSIDGTHLGHNIPDKKGHRFCINLSSIAGSPNPSTSSTSSLT